MRSQFKKKRKDRQPKKNCLLHAEKNQEKFHQQWRQTEREKERLLHLQMKNDASQCCGSNKLIPRDSTGTDTCKYGQYSDSKKTYNNPWGRKVWKSYTGLAFYRGMPVAVKQFNEGVSQAEVEHEANVTLFPHLIRPNLSCLYYNSNSFSAGTIQPISMIFLTVFGKIWF